MRNVRMRPARPWMGLGICLERFEMHPTWAPTPDKRMVHRVVSTRIAEKIRNLFGSPNKTTTPPAVLMPRAEIRVVHAPIGKSTRR